MISANKRRFWLLLYAVCCLIYVGWVTYLGSFDFNRVLREYRRAVDQMEAGRIRSAAWQELVAECRKSYEMQSGIPNRAENGAQAIVIDEGVPAEQDCFDWLSPQLVTREAEIRESRLDRQKRAGWKLLLFSLFFVVIFLIFPPALVYLFAMLFVRLFRTVKIVRKE